MHNNPYKQGHIENLLVLFIFIFLVVILLCLLIMFVNRPGSLGSSSSGSLCPGSVSPEALKLNSTTLQKLKDICNAFEPNLYSKGDENSDIKANAGGFSIILKNLDDGCKYQVMVIVTCKGCIRRVPTLESTGGIRDPGENIWATGLREFIEETGIQLNEFICRNNFKISSYSVTNPFSRNFANIQAEIDVNSQIISDILKINTATSLDELDPIPVHWFIPLDPHLKIGEYNKNNKVLILQHQKCILIKTNYKKTVFDIFKNRGIRVRDLFNKI